MKSPVLIPPAYYNTILIHSIRNLRDRKEACTHRVNVTSEAPDVTPMYVQIGRLHYHNQKAGFNLLTAGRRSTVCSESEWSLAQTVPLNAYWSVGGHATTVHVVLLLKTFICSV